MAWVSATVVTVALGLGGLTLGSTSAVAALLPSGYASSAHISPYLVTAHLELSLAALRAADRDLAWDRGNGEAIALNFNATRTDLADAADQLGLARMATVDPDERARIDGVLSGIEDVRRMLDTEVLRVSDRLRALQAETLKLYQVVRAQVSRTETALAQSEAAGSKHHER